MTRQANASPALKDLDFRLRDESLEETTNLPDPAVLAAEIAGVFQAVLERCFW